MGVLKWGLIEALSAACAQSSAIMHTHVRAACLQNETAPEKLLDRYEKRFEKREKKIRKTIRNVFEKMLAPLRPLKSFSPALFNKF